MHTITKEKLEQALTERINEAEAELAALKAVTINTKHKTLTNRAVEGGTIGDYIGIGKALYVHYTANHRYQKTDVTAYSYNNEDGTEIGSEGGLRTSRTLTPAELKKVLDNMIEGREASIKAMKLDLINAGKFTAKYNKLVTQLDELTDSATWATRGALK